jgi:hypothetical protein
LTASHSGPDQNYCRKIHANLWSFTRAGGIVEDENATPQSTETAMADDPLTPNSPGAWVTTSPSSNRAYEAPDPPPDVRQSAPARSAHWGLASLLIGGPLLIGVPVQLQLNRNFWTLGPHGMNMPVTFASMLGCLIVVLALGGTSIFCGVRGWMLAVSERQPLALGLAGTALSSAAVVLWLGIFADLLSFFFQHMR